MKVWLLGALLAVAGGAQAQTHTLTILHSNDLQGRFLPEVYYDEGDRGGWARIARVLKSAGPEALRLDGGDALGPSTLAHFDGGYLAMELMSESGYDAMAIGNHEFDFGLDTLLARSRQAAFPLLGANLVSGQTSLFPAFVRVRKGGIEIGLVGVLSPSIMKVVNPRRIGKVQIGDPAPALRAALDSLAGQVDYCIVLAHMPEEEVLDLARAFPEVDLFVAGGYRRPEQKGALRHRVELVSGVRIVTAPSRGAFVGRVDIEFERQGQRWEPVGFAAGLVPVDGRVEEDLRVAARIGALVERFEAAARQPVGRVSERIADSGAFVADLLRTRAGAEIGLINQGALRPIDLEGEITRGTIENLIRFDDALFVVEVKGRKLKQMAENSRTRVQAGQRLIFSGYDPAADRVDGRPLNPEEVYRVATTGFLAAGGDEYLGGVAYREADPERRVMLRELLIGHFQAHPDMGRWDGLVRSAGGAWKSRTKVSGSLSRTNINSQAGRYKGISFLGGQDAMAWNSLVDQRLWHESQRGVLAGQLRSSFGQVRNNGSFREAADRLQAELVHTWQTKQPAPFLSLEVNSVWTKPGGDRPLTTRLSAGLHRAFGSALKMRLGLGLERDFATDKSVVGVELVPEYQRKLRGGNALSSTLKIFMGATQERKVSVQHYNSILVNLLGDLHATIDANFFLHRDSLVDRLGFKSEVQIGLGYTWERKWF